MTYSILVHKRVLEIAQRQGIKPSELQLALNVLDDIAEQQFPRADWRVAPIRCTDMKLSRVKVEHETWRAIIKIDDGNQRIVLEMVLRRNENTYAIVEAFWLREAA